MKSLKISKLAKNYGTADNYIGLKEIDLECKPGEIIGMLGENGAGKTTMLKCVAGIVEPTGGNVYLDDENLLKMNVAKRNEQVFYVAEGTRSLWWRLTLKENIEFVCQMMWGNFGEVEKELDKYLELFNLSEKKNTLVGELSRGQQQKILILLSIISKAKIIIMDEPTLGVDVSSKKDIIDKLLMTQNYAKEKIYLISSHDMDFISKIADRVAILKKGQLIAFETVENIKDNYFQAYFEIHSETMNDEIRTSLESKYPAQVIEKDGKYIIKTKENKTAIEIITYLAEKGILVQSMGKNDISLEDLFIQIQEA